MITVHNEETTTVMTRPAVFDRAVLINQAHLIYDLAMNAGHSTDEEYDKYRTLMGVANLLYDIHAGRCTVTVVNNYDNLGIY